MILGMPLLQIAGNRFGGMVPVTMGVVVAPGAADDDQRYHRAFDEQRGRAIIVTVARINIGVVAGRRWFGGRITGRRISWRWRLVAGRWVAGRSVAIVWRRLRHITPA
jgi:hypothetical protein